MSVYCFTLVLAFNQWFSNLVACENHLASSEKILMPEPHPQWSWNNWSGIELATSIFSKWSSFEARVESHNNASEIPTWCFHISTFFLCVLPPFYYFPICCFSSLLCTSLTPDRWNSQTIWHMKRDTVKHKKQEVTRYLTSVLLAFNIQEGCVPVIVL